MKLHYFEQETADTDDIQLSVAKAQGYVPQTCLLSGIIVMDEVMNRERHPCDGCAGPRQKCQGRAARVTP